MNTEVGGHTTQLLRKAPANTIFICNSAEEIPYMRALLAHVKRPDIKVYSKIVLDNNAVKLQEIRNPIVLDHKVLLSTKQFNALRAYLVRVNSEGYIS